MTDRVPQKSATESQISLFRYFICLTIWEESAFQFFQLPWVYPLETRFGIFPDNGLPIVYFYRFWGGYQWRDIVDAPRHLLTFSFIRLVDNCDVALIHNITIIKIPASTLRIEWNSNLRLLILVAVAKRDCWAPGFDSRVGWRGTGFCISERNSRTYIKPCQKSTARCSPGTRFDYQPHDTDTVRWLYNPQK